MQQDPRTAFPFAQVQFELWNTEISVKVIEAIYKSNVDEIAEEIDGEEKKYTNFVERLLDVDLRDVRILRNKEDSKNAEGSATACGPTNHIILLPPIGIDFVSPDLLIHELGHTAEFTLRRASNDIEMVRSHKFFSEAIAHFCQYRYLLEFGTKAQRIGAIGSVAKDHLLLRALVATDALLGKQQFFHVEPIIEHDALAEYRAIYTIQNIKDLLEAYEGKQINQLYLFIVEARMGAVLALHLIHNEVAIKQLCTVKTDATAREMLDRLNLCTDKLLDFSKSDELIRQFIDATI